MEKAIIVTQAGIARRLIKDGEKLIDIKPHKKIPNASVFVFKPSENIERIIEDEKNKER